MKQLSVVIPCYNEERNIPELYKRLSAVCRDLQLDYELIFVNDGSNDETWNLLTALASSDNQVIAIKLSRNFGHENALTAGLHKAKGNNVLIIDADLQDPPELLAEMLKILEGGADVVYGVRKSRRGEPAVKLFSAKIFYRLLNMLTDIKIPLDTGDFRLMRQKVVESFLTLPENQRFIRGMIAWTGFHQVPLYYNRDKRFSGATKYNLRKLSSLALDAISAFSVRPLRITFYMGLGLAFFGLVLLGYVIWSWVSGRAVPGWSSLAVLLIFLQSCQFIFLGIIGEYIGRIFIETKGRPLYLIDQVKESDGK